MKLKQTGLLLVVCLSIMSFVMSMPQHGHTGGGGGGYGHQADHGHGGGYGHETYAHAHPKYDYGYGVKDSYKGVDYGHHESRDGYATKGSYHVLLPDGRIQTVTYHVDDAYSGFVAEVTYSGTPHYGNPAPHHAPEPAYHAPEPAYHSPEPAYHAPKSFYHG